MSRCDLSKSSWRFVVRAAAILFPSEKDKVIAAVCKYVGERMLGAVQSLWTLPAKCGGVYRTALEQYVTAKLQGADELVTSTLQHVFERVYPAYLLSLEPNKESCVFWASRSKNASTAGAWDNADLKAYTLNLRYPAVHEYWTGKSVEDVFPLLPFFSTENGPTGAVSLAKILASFLPACSPIKYDLSERTWRHYWREHGMWTLADVHIMAGSHSVDKRPMGEQGSSAESADAMDSTRICSTTAEDSCSVGAAHTIRCTDPVVVLSECIRAEALPLYKLYKYLAKRCSEEEEQGTQMSDKAKAIYLFMSKFCESHSTIAKVLESLAMCDTMKSHFDKQPAHLLCCPNGVINLKEGKLIESSPDTEKWIRSCEFTEVSCCRPSC